MVDSWLKGSLSQKIQELVQSYSSCPSQKGDLKPNTFTIRCATVDLPRHGLFLVFILFFLLQLILWGSTARCWEDETRNGHRNTKRNPQWWKLVSPFKWAIWKETCDDHRGFRLYSEDRFESHLLGPRERSVSIWYMIISNPLSHWLFLSPISCRTCCRPPSQEGTVTRITGWTKNEGPLGNKSHRNREITARWAVGMWWHWDSWLGPQMSSVLEPNTNAQRTFFLSHILGSSWHINVTSWHKSVTSCRAVSIGIPGTPTLEL